MPPRPFVNDALWRCLCPRWAQIPVQSSTGFIGAAKRISARPSIHFEPAKQSSHTYNTAATAPSASYAPVEAVNNLRDAANRPPPHFKPQDASDDNKRTTNFVRLSTEELYSRLRIDAAKGLHQEVLRMLNILIKDRRERPNLQMYTALLQSYVSPEWGTAGKIRKTLEDMAIAGVELDHRACECVLEALAVHPDSFVRTDILEYMRERWWSPTSTAQSFVIAGLLRERRFEQALERLETMLNEGTRIEPWLWDKAIWMLLEFDEVEEAFYVLSLKRSISSNMDVSLSGILWTQLLDVAGKRHIPEAARMIWYSHVVPGYLKPTTGTCLNVLSAASRVGDVKLATDVFRVLAERNTVLNNHHYETLIQCYLVANDLPAALSVVLIMQDSGLKVREDELHPLFAYLSKDKERPMNAFMQLQDLEREGRKIPTAAVNICIAASIRLRNLPEAIEFYKALKSVAKAGPTTATFNELFRGCYRNGRKELAMYLANEMIELNLRPDRLTYDRLILTCIHAGDLDDAISYLEEMRLEGLVPRRGTHEDLVELAFKAKDGRCVALLKWYKQADYRVEARVATLERLIMKHFQEGGERKKDVTGDKNGQDALDASPGEWSEKVDQAPKLEENPQDALMGSAKIGAEAKSEAIQTEERMDEPTLEDSETQPQPQTRSPNSVVDYTKFHV